MEARETRTEDRAVQCNL